jgi:outer membrane protein OmpA-like peptidoglycan-associated protein
MRRLLLPCLAFLLITTTGCNHLETTVDAREYDHNTKAHDKNPSAKNDAEEKTNTPSQANNDPFGDLDDTATAANTNESELYLDKIEYALRAEFPHHKVQIIREPTAVRVKLTAAKVFAHNSATITPEATTTLATIAKVAEHFNQSVVSIQHYYNKHNEKNMALAEERNNQVADYLKNLHVSLGKSQLVEDATAHKTAAKSGEPLEIVFAQPANTGS